MQAGKSYPQDFRTVSWRDNHPVESWKSCNPVENLPHFRDTGLAWCQALGGWCQAPRSGGVRHPQALVSGCVGDFGGNRGRGCGRDSARPSRSTSDSSETPRRWCQAPKTIGVRLCRRFRRKLGAGLRPGRRPALPETPCHRCQAP